ncbi:MAG TPA: late competence development ComFB family protein [Gemmatimonadaceae bacterium]|nr:late competence development ComFB family protein [Gemmatimonadaceae bacterium]
MKNIAEEAIAEAYEKMRSQVAGFCGCAKCRDDAISHALNHIRPRYSTGQPPGSVISRLELTSESGQAQLIAVVLEAIKTVAAQPRHQTPPTGQPAIG